jgi:hypothetical protein
MNLFPVWLEGIYCNYILHCRLVEEADYKSTQELFSKRDDDKTLDNFIPKSESDFLEYAELISQKLRTHEVCEIVFLCFDQKSKRIPILIKYVCFLDAEKLPLYWFTQSCNETINDYFESSRCKRCCIFCQRNCK